MATTCRIKRTKAGKDANGEPKSSVHYAAALAPDGRGNVVKWTADPDAAGKFSEEECEKCEQWYQAKANSGEPTGRITTEPADKPVEKGRREDAAGPKTQPDEPPDKTPDRTDKPAEKPGTPTPHQPGQPAHQPAQPGSQPAQPSTPPHKGR